MRRAQEMQRRAVHHPPPKEETPAPPVPPQPDRGSLRQMLSLLGIDYEQALLIALLLLLVKEKAGSKLLPALLYLLLD